MIRAHVGGAPARRALGVLAAISMAGLLAACAGHGQVGFLPEGAEPQVVETIIVSTTRRPSDTEIFSSERDFAPNFAVFDISIPRDRELGSVSFPQGVFGDPAQDFLIVSGRRLPDDRAFVRAVNDALATRRRPNREVALFVHGYNNNFAEGLYRHTQLFHDVAGSAASVHFSWPSAARTQLYLRDQESALFSRTALERTILDVTRTNADQINLVAHSMGTFLMMETLKLMARNRPASDFRKINAVILIAPDIDVDVFIKQARPILALGVPIFLVVSSDDRALRASARLRGQQARLGAVTDPVQLGGLEVSVFDVSDVEGGDSTRHLKLGTSPDLIEFLERTRKAGIRPFDDPNRVGLVGGGVRAIRIGTDALLDPLAGR